MDTARLGEMCDEMEAEDQAEAARRRAWLTEQFGPRQECLAANNFSSKMWQLQDEWEGEMGISKAEERDMTPEEADAAYDAADAVPMDETHINKVLAFVLERARAMTDSPPATQTEDLK